MAISVFKTSTETEDPQWFPLHPGFPPVPFHCWLDQCSGLDLGGDSIWQLSAGGGSYTLPDHPALAGKSHHHHHPTASSGRPFPEATVTNLSQQKHLPKLHFPTCHPSYLRLTPTQQPGGLLLMFPLNPSCIKSTPVLSYTLQSFIPPPPHFNSDVCQHPGNKDKPTAVEPYTSSHS